MKGPLAAASAAILCVVPLIGANLLASGRRPPAIDDLLRLEKFGEVAMAPDGGAVAFVRIRPQLSARAFGLPFLQGGDRADIWLASLSGGSPENLTHGEVDGSGYWMPTWSPNGKKIALLSTKGGDNVWLYVWDRGTGELTRLSRRGVATATLTRPFQWIDDNRLIVALLPEGEQTVDMTSERQGGIWAARGWGTFRRGQDVTASQLDSGVPADLDRHQQVQWTLLNLGGASLSIMSGPLVLDIRARYAQVAPDGQHVALLRQVALAALDHNKLLQHQGIAIGLSVCF